ncbi:conserved hypothetical protein [Turicibacter sanguinis PC909]|uniref:Thoeris protein ThsB TIR-like domain-containing protein n=1 Tax=Turicibacter sanguinis PC909 TaxID=702450 RepID=A0ABP2HXV8_9FIRM|nr:TIR domain-containing protein [Turicibacter sanguinis]EFF62518.1 conserved hypothetical protein [Turicibacter sanguinis PC909]
MGYRNGIYVAFNGCGTTNPTESDIKYFNILKGWKENKKIDFSFVDSHQKTYKVLDSSTEKTLLSRLNERMANSKLMFLIVTDNTKNSSHIVDHEIIRAIEHDNIPIVVAYTDKEIIKSVSPEIKSKLPKSLQKHIKNNECKILFIPFKMKAIKKAFQDFGVNQVKEMYNNTYVYPNVDSWE